MSPQVFFTGKSIFPLCPGKQEENSTTDTVADPNFVTFCNINNLFTSLIIQLTGWYFSFIFHAGKNVPCFKRGSNSNRDGNLYRLLFLSSDDSYSVRKSNRSMPFPNQAPEPLRASSPGNFHPLTLVRKFEFAWRIQIVPKLKLIRSKNAYIFLPSQTSRHSSQILFLTAPIDIWKAKVKFLDSFARLN